MNSLSTFGSMLARGGLNMNSMTFINRYAKSITADFSGSSFIDLSNTYQYAVTSSGLNMTNGINGNTFARLKNSGTGTYLKTADFNSTGSFTIYLKHAARYSTLPALNFQYPNVIQLSKTIVSSGESFSATFFSSLNPGTVIPYVISGCTITDLGIASLSGTFMAPYQTNSYTLASSQLGKTITFNVSGGTAVQLLVYTVVYLDTTGFITPTVTNGTPTRNTNGLLFTGSEYIVYGSYPNNVPTNCLNLGQNSFNLIFDVKYTAVTDGYPWCLTPDYSKGLMFHTLVDGQLQDVHIWINSFPYTFRTTFAINTLYKYTITRQGRNMNVIVSTNGGADTTVPFITASPPPNHTVSNNILIANTNNDIIDLGNFALRIGGWRNNSSYTTTTPANDGEFKGYIKNFSFSLL